MALTIDKTKQADSQSFSCPGCGGRLVFDPTSQKLKCPYCSTLKDIDLKHITPREYDIGTAPVVKDDDWGSAMHVMRCQGCGAEIVLEKDVSADMCAFCGAPHVMEDQQKAGIAPESMATFRMDQQYAVDAFRKWIKKKWFTPGKAKKMAALGNITGVYLPHWTYDAQSTSRYQGQAGHHYYVTVPVTVHKDGKTVTEMRQEQRTRWEPASGVVSNNFDDILVAGSERLPEELLARVRPYDLKKLVDYRPQFLSGFASEKPAVDVMKGWGKAQAIIDSEMRDLARRDILSHADEAQVSSVQTDNKNVKYKLTLLPMYLSAFKYKQKSFHVLVNGQTGKVGGQAPVSALRVMIAVLLGIALLVFLYLLLSTDGNVSDFDYFVKGW